MNASGSYQDLFNNDTSSDLFAGLVPNTVVVTDHESLLQSVPLPDGKFLVGAASGVRGKSLKGTARQISVAHSADDVTLELPQDIDTLAEPEFANLHSLVDGVNVRDFKDDYDSKIDQSVKTTAEPTFANIHSLVDSVDVGAFKNDYDSKVDQSVKTTAEPTFTNVHSLVDGVDVGDFKDDYDAKVDQSVKKTAEPTFANVHSLVDGVDVGDFKDDYDAKVDQSVKTTAEPTFANLHSLVDGVDVGAFKTDYDSKVNQSVRTTARPTFAGVTTSSHVLPSSTGTIDRGSSSQRFRELFLGRGNGRIGLGHSMRVTSQAELHLNASGDNRSEITFGTNDIARANCKWAFNAFRSNEGNHFSLMRGPAINDDNWEYVLHVDGGTSQFRYNVATDATSTTTGSATFAGGVGIAKTLHAASVVTESLTIGGSPVDLTGYVTLSSAQDITGAKVFKGGLYLGDSPTDLATLDWDNIGLIDQPLNKDSYSVEFKAMKVGQLKVDGMWLEPATYVTLGGAQTLTGAKTFGQTLLPSSTAVDIGSPSSKFGNVYAANLRADTVYAGGSEINFSNLVTIFDAQVITGPKTFVSSIMPGGIDTDIGENTNRFRSIYAWGIATQSITVDGTNIDFGSYVTLGGNQTITGQKTFSGQVNVGAYNLTTMPWQYLQGVDQDLSQTSAVTFADLTVAGTAVTPANYVTLDSKQTITGDKTFSGALSAAFLQVAGTTVTPASYVTLGGTQTITGDKTFTGALTAASLQVGGTAVTPANYVTLDSKQTITGDKTFTGALAAASLSVAGTAVTPANYVTLGGTQTITGDKTFSGQVNVGEYNVTTMPWQHLQGVDQDLSQTSAVTFASVSATDVTVSGLGASVVGSTAEGKLQTLALASTNGVVATVAGSTLTINTPQDLRTAAAPTFANLWFTGLPFSVGHAMGWLNQGVTTSASPQFAGLYVAGNTRTDTLTVYDTITADTLTVNGTAVEPNRYVTTDTNQYIGGVKTFGFDLLPAGTSVNVGRSTNIFGVVYSNSVRTNHIRLGSSLLPTNDYPAPPSPVDIGSVESPFNVVYCNDIRVDGKWVTPANYVTLDTAQTVSGAKSFGESISATSPAVNLGTAMSPFGNVYLGRTYGSGESAASGLVQAGIGIRASRRAELHLHSAGDDVAEIMFGTDTREDPNVKWALSSREPSTNDAFRLFRGPKLTGGGFATIIEAVGSGTDAGQTRFLTGTNATSTTTGSVTFAGGIGVAKTLHANAIVAGSLTVNGMPMYQQGRRNDTLYTLNIGTYNTSTMPDIHMVRVGNQITLTFRLVTFTIATGQPTLLSMYGGIPPDFRPQHLVTHAMFLTVNNAYPIQAMCTIDNAGNINITPIPSVYYTGATNRVEPFSISFCHYA